MLGSGQLVHKGEELGSIQLLPRGEGLGSVQLIPRGEGLGSVQLIPRGEGLGSSQLIPRGEGWLNKVALSYACQEIQLFQTRTFLIKALTQLFPSNPWFTFAPRNRGRHGMAGEEGGGGLQDQFLKFIVFLCLPYLLNNKVNST